MPRQARQREGEPPRGIACPKCGCRHFVTTHTEPLAEGRIRRRKSCRHCGHKVVTFEQTLGFDRRAA